MTIEIRELVIKTEIKSFANTPESLSVTDISAIKEQIIKECKRALKLNDRKNSFNR
ncbi:MAG: hypothetical protein KUG80_02460 [Gammaproteobacteria bacterium]|nr:hypothetical protein [Gammaproteobacteria bacterium]